MIRFSHLIILAVIFQVITSQGPQRGPGGPPGFENIPEKCRRPPKVENPDQCCQVDSIYTAEELSKCGFDKEENKDENRQGPPDCTKPICLLSQKGFMDENNKVKINEVADYIDKWAGTGDFKDAAKIATDICLRDGTVPGPPQICEPARLMHCVGSVIFSNCPDTKWLQTDNCKAFKEHMEECKAFF